MALYIFITALLRAIGVFIDKVLTQKGITRFDYFFYMCFSMLPFSLIMMVFEPIRFELNWKPILLLCMAAFLRYFQQHAVVGIVRKSEPYQYQTYLTMGIAITYIIDCFLGTRLLNWQGIFSVLLVLCGILLVGSVKFERNSLNKDILTRVICGIITGYVTFCILKYWSNALYIFILNLVLTISFAPKYSKESHKGHLSIIKWVFLQQTFGFSFLFMTNNLMAQSVTLGIYVLPVTIVLCVIFSHFKNYSEQKLDIQKIFGICMVLSGILLLK